MSDLPEDLTKELAGERVVLATVLCPACEKIIVCFYTDLLLVNGCPYCMRVLPGKGTEMVQ